MSDAIDLSQKGTAREDELEAVRAHVERMFDCRSFIADAVQEMWDCGAIPSEIVKTLRQAADEIERANQPGQS